MRYNGLWNCNIFIHRTFNASITMGILKKLLPHAIAVVVFVLVTLIYFSPILDGKRLEQHDILQSNGASKEIADYREKTGEEALWTNSMFGGMPAYQISVQFHNNWTRYINKVLSLGIPSPAYMLFIALLGFYITLLCFGVNPWLSIAGAFAYGFSAYFMIIVGAGHNTQMRALAYTPPIIGGLYLAYYRRKIWLGMIIVCLSLGIQILSNHIQITYYAAILILIFMIFELVRVIKDKQYSNFVKASAAMIVALVLAVGVNITNMLLTAEYTPYSTRGPSELTDESGDQTKGLDKSYILNDYSYGIAETMNLFIPNFMGGASVSEVGTNSAFYEALVQNGIPAQQAVQICKQVQTYWGDQRYVAGPVYIGAVVIFLFVLGLFVVKGPIKWWLVVATVLSILLAWGKNFMVFSDLFINYFPIYNKFRAVTMILVIAELTIPLLGILAVNELLGNNLTSLDKQKAIKKSLFIVGGIALFFTLFPGLLFNFSAPSDANYPDWLLAPLHDTREALMRSDAFRSLLFVLLVAALLWFMGRGKLKVMPACILLALLVLVDLWAVDKRYLNNSHFVKAKAANIQQPSAADLEILQDKSLDYRVLIDTVSTFNDATTSFFHKSIGGYHGAKMKRYQELIEYHIGRGNMSVLDMLNTKYFIVPGDQNQPVVQPNQGVLGNAWLVEHIKWVDNADAEIAALTGFNPAKEVVIDKRYQSVLEEFKPKRDSTASINMLSYEPNHLVYEYQSNEPQMVVFSEIFYDKGWNAYIDGVLTPHVRANYVLRAMEIPSGKHQVVFKFEPKTYAQGEKIALASSIAIVLLVLGAIAKGLYDAKRSCSIRKK